MKMKSKTSRRPSFLAKPNGTGRSRRMMLPPKRSILFDQQAVERRIEVDWRDNKAKAVNMWDQVEEGSQSEGCSRVALSDPVSNMKRKVSDEKRRISDEKRRISDEKRNMSDEKRKVSDELKRLSDEKRKLSDENRKLSDERRRRQINEKAKEEGREKLSQFIRKEIVYPHLLQVTNVSK